ncbi:hypothetical protein AU476_39535 [Cupriavidus sp. UYMSc13B]|nr:hypothetical protein AU476_39535 [Cupriavidus sp. UYMSc13B]
MSRQFDRDLALMDRPLDHMDGLAAVQRVLHLMAESGEIVDQEDRAKQPAEMYACFVDGLAACCRTEACQRLDGRTLPTLDGCGNADQLIPAVLDQIQPHVVITDGSQFGRHVVGSGHVEAPVAQMS